MDDKTQVRLTLAAAIARSQPLARIIKRPAQIEEAVSTLEKIVLGSQADEAKAARGKRGRPAKSEVAEDNPKPEDGAKALTE